VFRRLSHCEKYQQLIHRHAAPFIRDVLKRFRDHSITANQGAAELQISERHFYSLRPRYLKAAAARRAPSWSPQSSGGNRRQTLAGQRHRAPEQAPLGASAAFLQLCRV